MSSTRTTTQQQVLTLLAEGSTITAAAKAVGIHRNTVTNWCRTSAEFHDALNFGQFRRAVHWHEQLQELGELAIQCLRRILTDENTPPDVRLNASLAVLDRIMKPSATLQNDAQSAQPRLDDEVEVLYLDAPETGKNATGKNATGKNATGKNATGKPALSAQEKGVEEDLDSSKPEAGRNAPCPCGSGLKRERCCFDRSHQAALN
jgi:transposase-like protein